MPIYQSNKRSRMEIEMQSEINPNFGSIEYGKEWDMDWAIDYVLVFSETSTHSKNKNKLESSRNIYLKNLVSYGLKLKSVFNFFLIFLIQFNNLF